MPLSNVLGKALLTLLATTLGGCSFLFVHGPPADHKTLPYFDCSTSNVLPTLDILAGAVTAIDAVGAGAGSSAFSTTGSSSTRADVAIFAGETALFAASAIYGYKKTSECRDAETDLLRRSYGRPPSFGVTAPPGASPPLGPSVPYDPWVAPRPAPGGPPPAPPPASDWDSVPGKAPPAAVPDRESPR
jgi:hypothetical protein